MHVKMRFERHNQGVCGGILLDWRGRADFLQVCRRTRVCLKWACDATTVKWVQTFKWFIYTIILVRYTLVSAWFLFLRLLIWNGICCKFLAALVTTVLDCAVTRSSLCCTLCTQYKEILLVCVLVFCSIFTGPLFFSMNWLMFRCVS